MNNYTSRELMINLTSFNNNSKIKCFKITKGVQIMKNENKQIVGKILIKRGALMIYDLCAICVAVFGALFIRFEFQFSTLLTEYLDKIMKYAAPILIVTIVIFICCHLYSSIWNYASMREMMYIVVASVLSTMAQIFIFTFFHAYSKGMPRSYYLLYCGLLFVLVFFSRFIFRAIREVENTRKQTLNSKNIMIVGAGDAGVSLLKEIKANPSLHKKVVCFVDDAQGKIGNSIHGVKVVGGRNQIPDMVERYQVQEILIAIPSAKADERKELLNFCKETGKELMILPGIYQIVNGEVRISNLKEVDVNDLLGRDPIEVDLNSIMGYVSNKIVMVTGGGGSIGSELCRQIAQHYPRQLIIVDIYENSTYDIQNELRTRFPGLNLIVLIASVRNSKRIEQIFEKYRPQIVYHAAAHKHVPLMEDSPNEAIKNNVLGTWKMAEASHKWNVEKFVMISTDKAVNPTNIMGASKRMCEMIVQSYSKRSKTEFVAVRFGNVLGSNGSVIPLFKKQIAAGGPVTVTHPDIIRFFMTIPEAVSLVLQAGAFAKGGEIFVLDMGEPVKIADLARNLILLSGHKPGVDIKIEYTGLRPGEKLYEELLMDEEGMQDTPNKLIHIGQPIPLDEESFINELNRLKEYVEGEPDDIRDYVRKLVPTYTPK